ncbi:SAM-dependent methyltransferase [Bradyrhizobium sp. S3.3.6]|uniref:methyltransferase domain-containing protein n=1 Tax=Bradyrhizobium sp. S3.3.6 TaxID=3156429 RepID=UPI003399FAE6
MAIGDDIRSKVGLLICISCRIGRLAAQENQLQCTNCGAAFPIVRGVPRFVPDDGYARSFGFQWNVHARTQLDSFTGKPISRNRLFAVSKWPAELPGQTILEAGSGAGRFTEALTTTGATVISLDLSSAVDANFHSNGKRPNLLIAQASLLDIPVPPRSMDKVICLGVLQHTPDPAEAFLHLANCVRPGGELVLDVYAARLRSLLSWKYLLRPITKRMNRDRLYRLIERATPILFPVSDFLYRTLGRFGLRVLPIVHYPELGLSPELSLRWAILDTFDMYSPAHDHPQTIAAVGSWFKKVEFTDVTVEFGPNGIIGRGRRPASAA